MPEFITFVVSVAFIIWLFHRKGGTGRW